MALTIDIIDDDDAVRESTRELLEIYGYVVRDYPTAEAFLGHSGDDAACLLVDHHMPGMTGLDLLEHLHAHGKRLPAVLMTGRSLPAMTPRVAKLGVKLLHKPIACDHLVATIEHVRKALR